MAIISNFPQNRWNITLNRVETSQIPADPNEQNLDINDVSISINGIQDGRITVTEISNSGSNKDRYDITLSLGLYDLEPSNVTISREGMWVVGAQKMKLDPNSNWIAEDNASESSLLWRLFTNRVHNSGFPGESKLLASDISIDNNQVTSISGDTLQRLIALETPLSADPHPSDFTINNHPNPTEMQVVAVSNPGLTSYLKSMDTIRSFLSLDLTEEQLPNSIVGGDSLRKAELVTLRLLNQTESQFDSEAASNATFAENARISVEYRTAAFLVPAFSDIIRQRVFETETTYNTYDLEKKKDFLIQRALEALNLSTPDGVEGSSEIIACSFTGSYNAF